MTLSFEVIGQAASGGSKRALLPKGSTRPRVIDANPKAKAWQVRVADTAASVMNGRPLYRGPLSVCFIFIVPRPKSHFGKKGLRPSAPSFPAKRPDLLKLARSTEDALTGVVFFDDAQIVVETLQKVWGEPARCLITVETKEGDGDGQGSG